MKTIYFLFLNLSVLFCSAQENLLNSGGGEYTFPKSECLSESQRQQIFNEIQHNRILLEQKNILKKRTQLVPHPLFIWPVTKNPAAPYNNVWSVSNYVDHNNSAPNLVQDWACGDRTYDGHRGIDIYTWPFTWYMVDNNQAWVVAAAEGTIIYKNDGNYDRNCSFNNLTWNAIYIQHADGSVAWYGHFKNGSLTTKSIGDQVVAGEYLGVVGSSGNSTGPHLHFEVYNASNQLVDTYTGACNNWTSSTDSWWLNQKPYQDPKINAVLTHSQGINFNSCPQTESTYLSDNFLSGSSVIMSIYLADQMSGTSGLLELVRPDNSIAVSLVKNFTDFYYASYWFWTYGPGTLNQSGTWKVRFTYLGNMVEHSFNYGVLANEDFIANKFALYPNPSEDVINIDNKNNLKIDNIRISDLTGKVISNTSGPTESIDLSEIAKGIYLISIDTELGVYQDKIIKK